MLLDQQTQTEQFEQWSTPEPAQAGVHVKRNLDASWSTAALAAAGADSKHRPAFPYWIAGHS
jgi:hypothetical protein